MGPSAPNGSGPLRLRLEPCGEGEQAFGAVDDGIVDHLAVHRDRGAALRLGDLETLHDPLRRRDLVRRRAEAVVEHRDDLGMDAGRAGEAETARDRKSTRLNSRHQYATRMPASAYTKTKANR